MNPRQRLLAEGLKNRLLGIQKSEQIYKQLSKSERKVLRMNELEIETTANKIAAKIEKYFGDRERGGKATSSQELVQKFKEELGNI